MRIMRPRLAGFLFFFLLPSLLVSLHRIRLIQSLSGFLLLPLNNPSLQLQKLGTQLYNDCCQLRVTRSFCPSAHETRRITHHISTIPRFLRQNGRLLGEDASRIRKGNGPEIIGPSGISVGANFLRHHRRRQKTQGFEQVHAGKRQEVHWPNHTPRQLECRVHLYTSTRLDAHKNRMDQIISAFRRLSLSILKSDTTIKDNVRGKRLLAGWNLNNLKKILSAFQAT